MISADVAHAYHPNYSAVQDITNYPVINQGFVFKSASNQSYAWDCEALAAMINLCEERQIPYQRFAKHSNTKGGGTIASILSSHLPVRGYGGWHSGHAFQPGDDGLQGSDRAEPVCKGIF